MNGIKIPNYLDYSRAQTISVYEAEWLLASIDLRALNIVDLNEYERLLKEKMLLAHKILFDAIDGKILECVYLEGPCNYDEYYRPIYNSNYISIKTVDFISFASVHKYILPDELTVLSTLPENGVAKTEQDKKGDNDTKSESKGKKTVAPATDNTKTVESLLKMVIAMAIDIYGYKPAEQNNTTTADIMTALEKCGLSVSENTIRTRLKQAQLLLPRD